MIAVILAVAAHRYALPIYREHLAIQEISRIHGTIDESFRRGPAWLNSLVGAERAKQYDLVVKVNLIATDADNATLAHMASLIGMEQLHVADTLITDDGLDHLKGLNRLAWLNLSGTNVSDAGVADLQRALPALTIFRDPKGKPRSLPAGVH